MKRESGLFKKGLLEGLPIGLGYFPIAFSLGVAAAGDQVTLPLTTLMAATSFTGVGQMSTMAMLKDGTVYASLFVALLIINLRNIVLSLSLSQRINPKVGVFSRLIMAMGNTDEIFALTIRKEGEIPSRYFLGVMTLPYFSWILGGIVGGLAGSIIPKTVVVAMSMALYAMLVSAVVPAAKVSKPILVVALVSAALSCFMQWVEPIEKALGSSGVLVIGSLISATIAAILFPVPDAPKEETE